MSNPRAPKVTGELKIPGFSTYMHFMDETHLLTIGFDASDQGDFAWFTGIMLQIFDVQGDTATLLHKEIIGSRGTTSDATDDHLAFNYFPSDASGRAGKLAIPMGICEGGNQDGGYGSELTFNGLLVFDVSVEQGFSLTGMLDHQMPHKSRVRRTIGAAAIATTGGNHRTPRSSAAFSCGEMAMKSSIRLRRIEFGW
ncbi:MAG: beta-propeller domain-containing protein [Myxococcales bacterium]|nr:MAG: beta-propeller domain-containing protein [Myxococcales bacterium]